ncbi:MAG: chromate transporter [Clostridia bacterium]|nr:chromate transporter [Clostridia bacterium]MBQ5602525.1 chromate transporter [Clostridia bacterium]
MKENKPQSSGKFKNLFSLAWVFFKIGLLTFGGGYAMIPIIQSEVSEKRKWISEEELMHVITIAESTPGPIAINAATYVGYKICGFFGSLAATVSVVLAPFTIIYLISLFLEQFMQFKVVENAFKGIQIAVAFLILSAGIKFIKKLKKQPFPIITVALTVAVMIALDLFALSFSSVYLILMGAFAGLMLTIIQRMQSKNNADKEENK